MSSTVSVKYPFVFFPPGNGCDIASINLTYMALLIPGKDREKNKFGVWGLTSLCLAVQLLDVFRASVSTFTHFWPGMMFRAPKVHSPFPAEHSLPGQ